MNELTYLDDGRLGEITTTTAYTVEDLEQYDIVLTTYGVVRRQYENMMFTDTKKSQWLDKQHPSVVPDHGTFPLFVIRWWFVILDEAHRIANPTTSISWAVRKLHGIYRLAMTGTPLHNDYTDVQGILAFLRLAPWSDLRLFTQVRVTFVVLEHRN